VPDPTPPKTVSLVSPEGKTTDVPADQAQSYIDDQHFTVQTTGGRAQSNVDTTVAEHSSKLKAAGYAFARGVSGGASDLLLNADQKIDAQDEEQLHGGTSLLGNVAGALVTGGLGAGSLGEHAAEMFSTRGALAAAAGDVGALGKTVGGVVEGSIYGAGQGLSEAALSDDPLTAENIMGHVGSNALLGGGLGGGLSLLSHGVGSVLERAGGAMREAGAAKGALASVPEDLAKLDETALKAEAKTAAAAHELDKVAEVNSLESLRGNQRAELANQILDSHEELRTAKIYQAVNDEFTKLAETGESAGVEKIEGISLAKRQLADSNAALSRLTKHETTFARDPSKALQALEDRQSALETMQEKMPQLRSALADNPAGVGLEHVDAALAQTKSQIDALKALDSKANPVTSTRLQIMKAGPSARMEQIEAAQKALADGKDLGIVGKGVKSIASSTASGLAHLLPIPGSSFAAHWMGEKAGAAVEWMGRKLSGAATKTADATAGHVSSFLDVAAKAPRTLKGPAVATATKTLSTTRFGAEQAVKSDDLKALFKARSSELKQQTMYAPQPDGTNAVVMRPEARAAMAQTFDGLRAAHPVLADKLETIAARRVAVQSKALPRKPDAPPGPQVGPDKWSPSDLEIRRWARVVRATEDPASVEERLAHGIVTPEEANAYREVYPERFAALQQTIFNALPTLSKTLPMRKKVALSIFTGIPITPAMRPEIVKTLQATFAVEPGSAGGTQAPKPQPSFGKFGSMKDQDKPTPNQERQS